MKQQTLTDKMAGLPVKESIRTCGRCAHLGKRQRPIGPEIYTQYYCKISTRGTNGYDDIACKSYEART